jgi:hypothetical protein
MPYTNNDGVVDYKVPAARQYDDYDSNSTDNLPVNDKHTIPALFESE